MLLCTGDGNIKQAAFLFKFTHTADTHRRREDVFFQSDNEYRRKFQSLSSMNGHQCHLRLLFVTLAVKVCKQGHLLQEVTKLRFLLTPFLTTTFYKVLHTAKEFLQILLSRQVLWIVRTVYLLADTAFHDDGMSQHISILLFDSLFPSINKCLETFQFCLRTLCQLESKYNRLSDDCPKRNVMQIGCFHYLTDSRVTKTSCGVVDDSTQRLLIIRISHYTEIGYDILDFLTLIEGQSAVNAVWYSILAHLLLKRTALRIRTIKDGKVTILSTLLSSDTLNVVAYDDSLLLVAIGGLQRESLALFVLAEDILANLSFVLANQRVSCLNDELRRTVVLLQFKEACALRVLLLEIEDIVDIGTSEAIDALRIVANHTYTTMLLCQLQHDSLLRIVRVLILVDQHIVESFYVLLTDILMLMKQQIGLHQQVVEIHGVSLSATLRIPIIYISHLRTLLLDIVCRPRAGLVGTRHQQMVLGHRNTVGHTGRLVNLVIELHLFDNVLDKRTRIRLVVNGKITVEADDVGFCSQNTCKDGVECAHLQTLSPLLPHKASNTLFHLTSSLVGKGQCQDVPRLIALF